MNKLVRYTRRYLSQTKNVYDLVVIGGGPGGYVAAIRAAQLGMNVACIEKRGALGGTCLNVGCIPSKALLHASELYMELDHVKDWGITVDPETTSLDPKKLQKSKSRVVTQLTKGIEHLFKGNGVTYIKGIGEIINADKEVKVSLLDGEEEIIQGENIIVATGSDVTTKDFLPIDENIIISSTGALDIDDVPETMAVLGTGAIALELGSVWSRFGSDVTVFYYKEEIARYLDDEFRKPFRLALEKQGLKFKLMADVNAAVVKENSCVLTYEDMITKENFDQEFDKVLVSVGRKPFYDGVGLGNIGVEMTDEGQIKVDNVFMTNVEGVYAIGDCIPGPMLAHKAEEDGIMCVEYIHDGKIPHVDYNLVPGVVYTTPEVSQIGLREQDLEEGTYNVGTFPFAANGRAKAMHATDGFVKVISDIETGKLLGMHMMGACCSEMIMEGALIMHLGLTVDDIAHACHPHPTLSEVVKEACMDCCDKAIHKL